jgi:hypothetical protein
MSNTFGQDVLARASRDVPLQKEPQGAQVNINVDNGDVGVQGSVSKDIGKNGFFRADGSWYRRAGYHVGVAIGWFPKDN